MKETKIKGININLPERSNWCCYLFGTENSGGFVYHPYKDNVPNAFARWMMKICFACTWIKDEEKKETKTKKKHLAQGYYVSEYPTTQEPKDN